MPDCTFMSACSAWSNVSVPERVVPGLVFVTERVAPDCVFNSACSAWSNVYVTERVVPGLMFLYQSV